MTNQPLCDQCGERQSCKDLYQKLGQDKGPSFMRAVLSAFLLPIVVFISVLAASQHLLAAALSPALQTIVSVLAAAVAVLACVLITKAIGERSGKRKQ